MVLSLIGGVAAEILGLMAPGMVTPVSLAVQAVILVLLWQYLQAVRKDEQDA